jgi:hypothetical protein
MLLQLDLNGLSEQIKDILNNALNAVFENSKLTQSLVTKNELAEALNCSVSTIDSLRRQGVIKGYRLGQGDKVPVRFDLYEVIEDIKRSNLYY